MIFWSSFLSTPFEMLFAIACKKTVGCRGVRVGGLVPVVRLGVPPGYKAWKLKRNHTHTRCLSREQKSISGTMYRMELCLSTCVCVCVGDCER